MEIQQRKLQLDSYQIVNNKPKKDHAFNRADLLMSGAELTITIQNVKFGIFTRNTLNYIVGLNVCFITEKFLSPIDQKFILQIFDNQINATLGKNIVLKIYGVKEEIIHALRKYINS